VGGDFRKLYALLEKLRSFFPPNVPFLATSATLPPLALRDVRSKLAIDSDTSFYLNLGNDRPNVAMSVQQINGSDDYEALRPLLANNVTKTDDMTKTIVFTNTVNGTQTTCKRVRQFFPKSLCKYVDFLHAHRTPRAKKRVMRRFRQGRVKILIATEAAGMVCVMIFPICRLSHSILVLGCRYP
jgi:superfamily II DNA helicase RecQ